MRSAEEYLREATRRMMKCAGRTHSWRGRYSRLLETLAADDGRLDGGNAMEGLANQTVAMLNVWADQLDLHRWFFEGLRLSGEPRMMYVACCLCTNNNNKKKIQKNNE